jgi:hypothetical protein
MSIRDTLIWLQGTPVAHSISKWNHLVGAGLQVVHILGFVLLLAAVMLLALRSLGLTLPGVSRARLYAVFTPILWTGVALTVLSGALMFASSPLLYYYNRVFDVKMLLFATAVIAQLVILRLAAGERLGRRGLGVASVASLVLWFAVSFAGRAIGFV